MTTFEQAVSIVTENVPVLQLENVPLSAAVGRVLAQDVFADINMPPFDKSAVDGYACRLQDIHHDLEVLGVIAAGEEPIISVGSNQCLKIMTGAKIPKGADCVLVVEDTELVGENMIRFSKDNTACNICYLGEDAKKGATVLEKGQIIKPQHIAVLATFGCVLPVVSKKVRIAFISTGDELVEPRETPSPVQIRNSNAWQLMAQASRLPTVVNYHGIVRDNEENTFKAIISSLNDNDLLLITGGISMGDFDLVPDALLRAGFKFHFRSVAVQPGRPTIFATNNDGKVCFALPGNPVSSFSQFELLVKPAIYQMMGHRFEPRDLLLPFEGEYTRKKSHRLSLIPIKFTPQGKVLPLVYHGSAHINALTEADGLMFVPVGITKIKEGDTVRVRQI